MKRKYGAARSRETLAEQRMREAAQQMHDNTHNFGSQSRKGAISRGKMRGRAYRVSGR
jgi:pyrroloquinoline quinone (PQQ) biosynthesis protein C